MKKNYLFLSLSLGFLSLALSCTKAVNKKGTVGDVDNGNGNSNPQLAISPVRCTITTAAPAGWSGSDSQTYDFNCVHDKAKTIVSVQCQLNDGEWENCDSVTRHTLHGLNNGVQKFRVRGQDADDNSGYSAYASWSVDVSAPVVDTAYLVSMTNNAPTLFFHANDGAGSGIVRYECRLDKTFTAWENCNPAKVYVPLNANEAYVFSVRAYDYANNVSPISSVAFTTNALTPQGGCQITTAIPEFSRLKNQVINFNCTSTGTIKAFECRVDGGAWSTCTSSLAPNNATTVPSFHNLNNLTEGAHLFEVHFLNESNVASLNQSIAWNVDTIAPLVGITDVHDKTLSPSFSFEGSDSGGSGVKTYLCKLSPSVQSDWVECGGGTQVYSSGISAGSPYVFSVKSVDRAGNESLPKTYSWVSNPLSGPTCNINTVIASGFTNTTSQNILFTCSSPAAIATYKCQLNGGAWSDCQSSSSQRLTALNSGAAFEFKVKAIDSYNNEGLPSAALHWTVDTLAPVAIITSVDVDHPNAKVNFTGADTGGSGLDHFECALDGVQNWTTCDTLAGKLYSGLTLNNTYTARVKLFDRAGNVSPEATFNFKSVPPYRGPICTLNASAVANWSNQTQRSFTISCRDDQDLDRTECSRNGSTWAPCVSPWVAVVSKSGVQDAYVRGVDRHGIIGAADRKSWNVDLVVPTVEIKNLVFADGKSSIYFSATDTGGSEIAKIQCQLDGVSTWSDCASPAVYTGGITPASSYVFRVRAFDAASNASSEASRAWTNGNWTAYGSCSALCGRSGNQTRSCTAPAPAGGGLNCEGVASIACSGAACPFASNDGWGSWSACTKSCGGGSRSRSCEQPVPDYQNSSCVAGAKQMQACNTAVCSCWDNPSGHEWSIDAGKSMSEYVACSAGYTGVIKNPLPVKGTDFFECKAVAFPDRKGAMVTCSNKDNRRRDGTPRISCCNY